MAHKLEKSLGLTQAQRDAIAKLEAVCNQAEGLTMKLNWSLLRHRPSDQVNDFLFYDDDRLIGYVALYAFGNTQAEVSAMVHPNFRRRGIFKQLLATARDELKRRGITNFFFINEQKSAAGKAAMTAISAKYEVSEYKMMLQQPVDAVFLSDLQLRQANELDIADIVKMDRLCFGMPPEATKKRLEDRLTNPKEPIWIATVNGETIGKLNVVDDQSETYIGGFCIYPEYRNKGYGRAILTQVVAKLIRDGNSNIALEVAATGRSALSLYERCGFQVVTAYDYYRLPVAVK